LRQCAATLEQAGLGTIPAERVVADAELTRIFIDEIETVVIGA
jgi:hypothetical protein